MQEKFSVVLEAVTNGFKSKMKEVQNAGQQTTIRMAQLKREISNLKSEMKYTDIGSQAFKEYAIAVDDAERELEELNQAQKQVKTNNNIFDNIGTGIKKMGNQIEGATKKVLRYATAVLSIRSIFALVRKASSSYLAEDTDLANKLQSAWAGLGSFLAPIIEKIANMILKLVGYLNVFIKAVTGQDLLAKASAKATAKIKDQTKATKGLNKSLTDMDEITNISKDETSGVGGAEGMQNPFDNFKDVELPWADKIKKFGEWVKGNWQEVLAILGGTILIIEGIKLAMSGGVFSLFGRTLAGIGVIIVGLTAFVYNLKQYMEDLKNSVEDTEKGWKHFGLMIAGIGATIVGIGIIFASWPVIIAGAITVIIGLLASFWTKIETWLGELQNTITSWANKTFGSTLGDIISGPIVEAIQTWKDGFGGLFKSLKQIVNGIIKLFKGDLAGGLKSIFKGIGNFFITVLNNMISGVNAFLSPFREIIVSASGVIGKKISFSKTKIPKIPMLATGTNYVPEDQMAYIHKGEAVIPKKFNSAEYFNNINNNQETNALLLDLNRTMNELLEKDTNLYINGKEFAQATYKDFKNEGNRLGTSNVVNVR